jgi:hypothetical protein
MTDTRLNGIIRAWEAGKPAFTCFAKADKQSAIDLRTRPMTAWCSRWSTILGTWPPWAMRCSTC